MKLCTLVVEGIWNMADGNRDNQTALLKEGCIPAIVSILNSPEHQMQTNAAGALSSLSRGHPENQAAIARSGALAPLCTMVRDAPTPETREESAGALWSMAHENAANKATIAKLGGIEPLVSMLMFASTDNSCVKSGGALATLSTKHNENRLLIVKRFVHVLSCKVPHERAIRLMSAVVTMCDYDTLNQIAVAKLGGVQHVITWLGHPDEKTQAQAAQAMLAIAANNATTQAHIASLEGIPPLVELVRKGTIEAQEHSTCALWHLARH